MRNVFTWTYLEVVSTNTQQKSWFAYSTILKSDEDFFFEKQEKEKKKQN